MISLIKWFRAKNQNKIAAHNQPQAIFRSWKCARIFAIFRSGNFFFSQKVYLQPKSSFVCKNWSKSKTWHIHLGLPRYNSNLVSFQNAVRDDWPSKMGSDYRKVRPTKVDISLLLLDYFRMSKKHSDPTKLVYYIDTEFPYDNQFRQFIWPLSLFLKNFIVE